MATALVAVAATGVTGVGENAVRALSKLARVLPARLRPQLIAVAQGAAAVPRPDVPAVDPTVLAVLAGCSRDQEIVSFGYRDRRGAATLRRVEPHGVVTVAGLWYLLAHDPDRDDWRIFRLDRVTDPRPTRRIAPPRPLPAVDVATAVLDALGSVPGRYIAVVQVELAPEDVRSGLFARVPGLVTSDGRGGTTVRVSAESAAMVVQYVAGVAALGAPWTLETSAEIRAAVHRLGTALRTG